jgi:hypothetical protein
MIKDILRTITLDDLYKFGILVCVLWRIDSSAVSSAYMRGYIRKAKEIDLTDTKVVDRFLYDSRNGCKFSHNREFSIQYCSILEKGISLALETADFSLTETLILVLRNSVKNHPELLKLAIKLAENNTQMQQVLYNCVRETIPEVRGYV